jgi:hypothetical protein
MTFQSVSNLRLRSQEATSVPSSRSSPCYAHELPLFSHALSFEQQLWLNFGKENPPKKHARAPLFFWSHWNWSSIHALTNSFISRCALSTSRPARAILLTFCAGPRQNAAKRSRCFTAHILYIGMSSKANTLTVPNPSGVKTILLLYIMWS